MKVIQVLPELNSGGVERGTLDFARFLVEKGHESIVISNGGRLVNDLQEAGSKHITYPVHAKSLKSFYRIFGLKKIIVELKPDIIHLRSRMPAWMVYLALKLIPKKQRPALVSTFHGTYSVSPYSEIMACGDKVIVISEFVKSYVTTNYPKVPVDKLELIYRGVDTQDFQAAYSPSQVFLTKLARDYPNSTNKPILLMPARLSSWKGQKVFLKALASLKQEGVLFHGFIVGEGKNNFQQELIDLVDELNLNDDVDFLGHRSDMKDLYAVSAIVFNLSQRPEPFGRTVIEALAMEKPVIAYNEGGPGEVLSHCFNEGLLATKNTEDLVSKIIEILNNDFTVQFDPVFSLHEQAEATLKLYHKVLN